MEIIKLATYENGMTQKQALEEAEKKGLELLTNKEHDKLLQSKDAKKYADCYPAWTGTHIKYKSGLTDAEVWNEGETKHTKIYLPLKDGWYLVDNDYGIPNGEPSSSSNPKARYLWRWQDRDFDGLVPRGYGWLVDDYYTDRRYVGAVGWPSDPRGVLGNTIGKMSDKRRPKRTSKKR